MYNNSLVVYFKGGLNFAAHLTKVVKIDKFKLCIFINNYYCLNEKSSFKWF